MPLYLPDDRQMAKKSDAPSRDFFKKLKL